MSFVDGVSHVAVVHGEGQGQARVPGEGAVVDGDRYALWPDGTFCRITDVDDYVAVLGDAFLEVIGIGRDEELCK